MQQKWSLVFSTTYMHKIEIAKAILSENDIPSQHINKMDSSYSPLLGEIELYVPEENEVLARFLLNKNNL
jgi:hypothetical protein